MYSYLLINFSDINHYVRQVKNPIM